MALNEEVKTKIEVLFKEVLDILNHIEEVDDPDEDVNGEALKYVEWIKTKAKIKYGTVEEGKIKKSENPTTFPLFYSGMYWAYLGTNVGDEINKHRLVVVIRSEKKSNLCTVIPLSTQRLADGLWYHIDLENRDSTAIVEQIQVISKKRFDKPLRIKGDIQKATPLDMEKVRKEIVRYYTTPPKPIGKE